jgi:hypothetical protein
VPQVPLKTTAWSRLSCWSHGTKPPGEKCRRKQSHDPRTSSLKDEFKARGLDCAEGLVLTVTASEVFKNTLDTARVREALGDHVKQFETLVVSTIIRIKPTRHLEVLAAA